MSNKNSLLKIRYSNILSTGYYTTVMKISVKVKTNAHTDAVEQVGEGYIVLVKALPVEGKANAQIEKLIAHYFDVAPSLVRVISGRTAKQKIIEIDN